MITKNTDYQTVHFTISLTLNEIKTLRRVFNALNAVPFSRTPKPSFDLAPLEARLRSLGASADIIVSMDVHEIEMCISAIESVENEYRDTVSLKLYTGCVAADLTTLKANLAGWIHAVH